MMTFKGNYDATKQYDFLDTVTYNGSSYVCLVNGTTTAPSDISSNWQLMAKAGTTPDTSQFALKSELPDLTSYAKKSELPTVPTDLVHTSDLQTVSETASEALDKANDNAKALVVKANRSDIPTSMDWSNITNKPDFTGYVTTASLIDYVKKTDLPDFTQFAKTTDLSQYALKKDIPTSIDTSNFATKTEVQQAQTTADNASQYARNDAKLIQQLSGRIDAIKMPDLSGYAKTSQIPTDVVTHAELTTTKWLDTGTTWLNGNTGSIKYRAITIGNYHIVEVTGSMYITTNAYAITSAFKIPLLGFEDSTTMHFSGGSTITNEIPVAFMAGSPGEVKLYTWQNVNHGWTEVHLSWTYVGGE